MGNKSAEICGTFLCVLCQLGDVVWLFNLCLKQGLTLWLWIVLLLQSVSRLTFWKWVELGCTPCSGLLAYWCLAPIVTAYINTEGKCWILNYRNLFRITDSKWLLQLVCSLKIKFQLKLNKLGHNRLVIKLLSSSSLVIYTFMCVICESFDVS